VVEVARRKQKKGDEKEGREEKIERRECGGGVYGVFGANKK
jgi:hypothetical protein